MYSDTVIALSKIAAPAGLAIGVFLLLCRSLAAKMIFPSLNKVHAYRIVMAFAIMACSIAMVSIFAWMYVSINQPQSISTEGDKNSSTSSPGRPEPSKTIDHSPTPTEDAPAPAPQQQGIAGSKPRRDGHVVSENQKGNRSNITVHQSNVNGDNNYYGR